MFVNVSASEICVYDSDYYILLIPKNAYRFNVKRNDWAMNQWAWLENQIVLQDMVVVKEKPTHLFGTMFVH